MIYFDNSASTLVYHEVAALMGQIQMQQYGNASALHSFGAASERLINKAREQIAAVLKCQASEIYFTGSGTEANNIALLGAARAYTRNGKHILTSPLEHASVSGPLQQLVLEGFEVEILPVDSNGLVSAETLGRCMRSDTILVSVMQTSNEIGTVQPLAELVQTVKRFNKQTLFHTDAVQGFGKIPINVSQTMLDFVSVSAHKLHGPKGVGCLFMRKGVRVLPITFGGGHENGIRSGTQSTEAIAGFGLATEMKWQNHIADAAAVMRIRERLMQGIVSQFGKDVMIISPHDVDTNIYSPYVVTVGFAGVKSEVLLHHLAAEEIYCSSGSACSSHKKGKSKTLLALDVPDRFIDGAIRFSFGSYNQISEVDEVLARLAEIYPKVRYDGKNVRKSNSH